MNEENNEQQPKDKKKRRVYRPSLDPFHPLYRKHDISKVSVANRKCGQYSKALGYTIKANGKLSKSPRVFYLGDDLKVAQQKWACVLAEWAKLQNDGINYWTEAALDALVVSGVIKRSKPLMNTKTQTLDATELSAYFKEGSFTVDPSQSISVLELGVKKMMSNPKMRERFFAEVNHTWQREPMATFERLTRIFGWNKQEAQQMMLIMNDGVNPFDVTDKSSMTDAKTNELVEAGIIKTDRLKLLEDKNN